MNIFYSIKQSIKTQYVISVLLVVITSTISFLATDFIGYRVVALLLLFVVSVLAMLFDIFPVLLTAILSAIIWNYFFIPPTFTFHIGTTEDTLMFLMYFVIASINAVLTFKIRQFEKNERDKEEKAKTIKLYDTLLNSLSHELRTPIATIIGAVDTIDGNSKKLSEGNKIELLAEIKKASLRLNRQVENLLSMSRLEAGMLKPHVDWFDVNELIFSVINDCKTDLNDHQIYFKPSENMLLIKSDRAFMEQIIRNIVYNALHHTPKNSHIKLQAEKMESQCQITISDDGPGFPATSLPFVFTKFYRLSHTATGGIGLGLSIAKGFTEALNGKITLENSASGGAKFNIKIPIEA